MHCAGSVALISALGIQEESDEPDYRKNGTAAHAVAAHCLEKSQDTFEYVGETIEGVVVDVPMADAVQVYLDECRPFMDGADKVYIEQRISAPEVHPQFFGTTDFAAVRGFNLIVRDYKHGEGILVDVEDNPQLLYYAYGILRLHPEVLQVELGIVQPRGFHPDGPVRTWAVSAEYVRSFVMGELRNAMLRTEIDNDLDAGSWCRFCPAKLVCPLMNSLFGAAAQTDPKAVAELSDAGLGRSYQRVEAVKFYLKALEEEVYNRLNHGKAVFGTKLVHKKANRVYKPGAIDTLMMELGEEAFNPATLKSPAEIDKISPAAKALTREWAYTPDTGLTVALETDRRSAVKVQSTTEAFAGAVAALGEGP